MPDKIKFAQTAPDGEVGFDCPDKIEACPDSTALATGAQGPDCGA